MASYRMSKETQKRLSNWLNSQRNRIAGACTTVVNDSMLASEFNDKFNLNITHNGVKRTRGVLGIHYRRGVAPGQDSRAASTKAKAHDDAALRSMVESNLRVALSTHSYVVRIAEELGIDCNPNPVSRADVEAISTPNKGGA